MKISKFENQELIQKVYHFIKRNPKFTVNLIAESFNITYRRALWILRQITKKYGIEFKKYYFLMAEDKNN